MTNVEHLLTFPLRRVEMTMEVPTGSLRLNASQLIAVLRANTFYPM